LNEDQRVNFDVKPDGQFHVYKLDLKDHPAWKGRVRSFRLDPCIDSGGHFKIDYIRFK
jgi:hypothetical protein